MKLVIVAEPFLPMRSSGAIQIRDLAVEFVKQGHEITLLVPCSDQIENFVAENYYGVEVVRLKALPTRDKNYVQRTASEFLMPYLMLRNLKQSKYINCKFDGVLWYSPTIFLGPLVKALKERNKCSSYLILRDIFPQWAADIGLINRGLPYQILKRIANYQYSIADVIGVQTSGNLPFFQRWNEKYNKQVNVLQNWMAEASDVGCSIDISQTKLSGRKIFVYAGNMGVAQGMEKMLTLAAGVSDHQQIGFVFVGRGTGAIALRKEAAKRSLDNIIFYDEIAPEEMAGLYEQCDVGLVSLDSKHTTHNIPGKFISYMHSGLPTLASINPENDLANLIRDARVGQVSTDEFGSDLAKLAISMVENELCDDTIQQNCKNLAKKRFSAAAAVKQIVDSLSKLQSKS